MTDVSEIKFGDAKKFVLVLPMVGEKVMLAMKPRSDGGMGAGLYNGYGGKVEAGEDVESAARRELLEESGLVAGELFQIARMYYTTDGVTISNDVFLCRVKENTHETDGEMIDAGVWSVDAMPLGQMWPDNRLWMPAAIREGWYVSGSVVFERDDSHPSGVKVGRYNYTVMGDAARVRAFGEFRRRLVAR